MRVQVSIAAVVLVPFFALSGYGYTPDEKLADQQSIEALQAKIVQAQPKDQCFLYAELIHQMTEFSVRQYAQGNIEKADDLLKQVQQIAHKVHLSIAGNDKRLKNAEILLRNTAFRLTEMLHSSSYEDRALVQQALNQVNQAENEAMLDVFKR